MNNKTQSINMFLLLIKLAKHGLASLVSFGLNTVLSLCLMYIILMYSILNITVSEEGGRMAVKQRCDPAIRMQTVHGLLIQVLIVNVAIFMYSPVVTLKSLHCNTVI